MTYKKFIRLHLTFSVALAALLFSAAAGAEKPLRIEVAPKFISLEDALAQAYSRQPELRNSEPVLRMPDTINEEGSGYMPSLNGESYSISLHSDDVIYKTEVDPKTYALELTQPLYRKESGLSGLQASDNLNKAQRALLDVKQQELAMNVVRAYSGALRDSKLVALTAAQEAALKQKVGKSMQDLQAGHIPKSDLIAAQIALVDAQASHLAAMRSLKKNSKTLEKLTGQRPAALLPPPANLRLPASLEDALTEAEKKNPQVLYTHCRSAAAQAVTRSIDGALSPQIDLNGTMGRTYDSYDTETHEDDRVIGLRATIPFFSGGTGNERKIQSRGIATQRRQEANNTLKREREKLIDAWQDKDSAARRMASCATARGFEEKSACIHAESDSMVARYSILAATGRLTAAKLGLNTTAENLQNDRYEAEGALLAADQHALPSADTARSQ